MIGGTAAPFAFAPAIARAQGQFPDRPIRIVVPVNAGGIADTVARVLQNKMGEDLGQPIVVENRTGASGAIAGTAVVQSQPDGHTWLIDGPSNVILPLLNKSMSVDYRRALAPVSQIMDLPYVFGMRKDFPANDLRELVAEAKRRPGEVTFGTTGAATTGYFMGELLQQYAGIKLNHIPFKGGSEVSRELLAGRIDMGMLSYNSLLPALQANSARVIALPGDRRLSKLPDIPTVGEIYPGYNISSWTGFFVPTGTPDAIQNRIVAALHSALKDPQVSARISETGCDPTISSRDEFKALVERDQVLYSKLIEQSGIRPG
jgi:tripartite-type tricarboxylate transporter receptor subunit TctC